MLTNLTLRRRALATSAAAVLALTLTACGSSSGTADTASDTGKASEGAFPVTITSALGDAVITEKPTKIVTLGQGSTETAIALGTVPVGMESYPWGSDETGYLPWIHDAVTTSGGKLPKQFTGGEELDIEAITELEPDLILATWSGVTQQQYDLLKEIAPTVAYPEKAWTTKWDEQIETVAKAMGQPEKAKELVGTIKTQLEQAGDKHTKFKDTTFSYIYTSGPGTLGVFKPTEQRVQMLTALGLKVDPVVDTFKETEGTDSALIGLENASKLGESDLIFTFYTDDKTRKEIEAQPLYAAIPAVKSGALVHSNDQAFVTASSMINPLTVPYTIDRYLPMIDAVIAKAGQ